MRRFKPLALLCAMVVPPLAAQVLPVGSPPSTAMTEVRPASPASPRLYFAARTEQLDGRRILIFEVRLNGKPHLQESVFLETAADTGNAFEILAERADLRARLTRLAARRANRLEIRVSADEQVIRPFMAWQSFLLHNQRIEAAGATPRKAFSLVLDHTRQGGEIRNITAKGMQVDPDCADQCNAGYWDCVNNGGCDYSNCTYCQRDYDWCVSNCPVICYEPKSQTSSTTSQPWNGPTPTGYSGCYKGNPSWLYGSYVYETVMETKHTTTTTTTHCDDTVTTSTSVSYTHEYCWESTPYSCNSQDVWWLGCS